MKVWENFEPVIGLEVHVQLNTKSKLFSSALNRFGDEPNVNLSEVCTGLPGSLPLLNREAVHKAVLLGCALESTIASVCTFDRKSYFYPDSPRNFQITQYDTPILRGGRVIAEVHGEEKVFMINRAHLEDDAGMLKHFSHFAGIDYNRAGVPLIEIVSEPCIHSPEDAVAYATTLRTIFEYLHISDVNMEEGSLRFDVNISLRKKEEKSLRPKVEIKNMNSFSNMESAIHFEILRQLEIYKKGKEVEQATFRFDAETGKTILMRTKENAEDYRYCPEPDLPPLMLSYETIEAIRKTLPELPLMRKRRYISSFGLSHDQAALLTSRKALADYFEEALTETSNGKALCNWIVVEFFGRFKDTGKTLLSSGIPAKEIGKLVAAIDRGRIHGKIAKDIADEMVLNPSLSFERILHNNPNLRPVDDVTFLTSIVDQVVRDHAHSVQDFLNGKERAFAFLVGQVMKATQGKASPEIVNDLLRRKLQSE